MYKAKIVHNISAANFNQFDYHQVYIPGGRSPVINGTQIVVPAGSGVVLDMIVYSATGSAGDCYLIGNNKILNTINFNIDNTDSIK
jgi:hypothetical protein